MGVTVATALFGLIVLSICVIALGREIGAQRQMIAQSPVDERSTAAHRAVSSGRIWLISAVCVVVAALVGVSVATASAAVG